MSELRGAEWHGAARKRDPLTDVLLCGYPLDAKKLAEYYEARMHPKTLGEFLRGWMKSRRK